MPQIAFAGLGRMGLPMCAALVSAGYQVTATDKRAEAEEAAVACGAIWRDTPADYQVPWELSDLVRCTYRRALARYGPVDGELLAVALLEEQAGHKLRPRNS